MTKKTPSGQDYLDAMTKQRVGACRHRAMILKAKIDRDYPDFKARIISNDCHAYIELKHKKQQLWRKIDLGGYPAKIQISEPVNLAEFKNQLRPTKKTHRQSAENHQEKIKQESQDLIQTYRNLFPLQQEHGVSPELWLKKLLSHEGQKSLVEVQSPESNTQALITIYKEAKAQGRPVFLANSPEDLICASAWIQKDKDNKGHIQKGPGGALYDFIQSNKKGQPLLLINYSNFKEPEVVRFNALLDDTRRVDGIELPQNFSIIGVQNITQPECYHGSDFTSRFDENQEAVLTPSAANDPMDIAVDDAFEINLYQALDWKSRLLGRWKFDGHELSFSQGFLKEAMASGRRIVIKNGPVNDPDYTLFWEKLIADGELTENTISHEQGYDWNALAKGLSVSHTGSDSIYNQDNFLLNANSVHQLFDHYEVNKETKAVFEKQGLLLQKQAQPLSLVLTDYLSESQWAELLDKAALYKVELNIQLLPGISLPEPMEKACAIKKQDDEDMCPVFDAQGKAAFIYSTDCDVSIRQLQDYQAEVIDISELKPSDLIEKWDAGLDLDAMRFSFSKNNQYLLQSLLENKNSRFILKGRFSDELLSALLPLIQQYPERLKLVTENEKSFKAFSPDMHQVTQKEQLALLSAQEQALLQSFPKEPLSELSFVQLQALCAYQKAHPGNTDCKAPWHGLNTLKSKTEKPEAFHPDTAEAETDAFINKRFHQINDALAHAPCVFIGGLTGVGKSTFIERHFKSRVKAEVYFGEDRLSDWADNPEGGYLFIDEANITRRDWSEFEGLYQQPPSMIINGQRKQLNSNHKVIFAGNPFNYGGSRHEPALFKRHGNTVIFEPLPAAVIYQSILKPVFAGHPLTEELSQPLLKAYDLLTACSQDKLLVTPRQLKTVAMLTLANQRDDEDVQSTLIHYMHLVLKPLLENKEQRRFDALFPVHANDAPKLLKAGAFSVTASRRPAWDMMSSSLKLRALKQKHHQTLNQDQLYGDLNSIVLESMPGLGKTEMLKALMAAHGLTEADSKLEGAQQNGYYILPVERSYDEKVAVLLKAFDEGNIVIMDEINASPMMERLLNALLSGQTPEGNKPSKPGFMLLGTQNPASMGARIKQTEAQNKRMSKFSLGEYPVEEAAAIAAAKGLPEDKAQALARAFQIQRDTALKQGLQPPNF